jgi:hypothetical protein
MIKIILRSIIISVTIGLLFALLGLLLFPSYQQHSVEDGFLSLQGIEALKIIIQIDGINAVIDILFLYFLMFFTPTFLGACIQGIWFSRSGNK